MESYEKERDIQQEQKGKCFIGRKHRLSKDELTGKGREILKNCQEAFETVAW